MEKKPHSQIVINNDFYDFLKEGWYTETNHPVALLRHENAARLPWIIESIENRVGSFAKILDVGCGAGLLANPLSERGYDVTGVDLSKESLLCAGNHDTTKKVKYLYGNALDLPFEDKSFDVVLAMDLLEHVDMPVKVIKECSRILRSHGLLFFHTFNKNFFSYLFIVKGIEWFVKNTPKNMHVYNLFIKPKDMLEMLEENNLFPDTWTGLRPKFSKAFFQMLMKREIPEELSFTLCKSLLTGYMGIAVKLE